MLIKIEQFLWKNLLEKRTLVHDAVLRQNLFPFTESNITITANRKADRTTTKFLFYFGLFTKTDCFYDENLPCATCMRSEISRFTNNNKYDLV